MKTTHQLLFEHLKDKYPRLSNQQIENRIQLHLYDTTINLTVHETLAKAFKRFIQNIKSKLYEDVQRQR